MASETANPTLLQYRAMANQATARVAVGMAEVKRRLMQNLPLLIDDFNTQLGYATPDVQIRKPAFMSAAPVGQTSDPASQVTGVVPDEAGRMNGILLAASGDAEFEGSGQFKDAVTVSIYSVDQRIETEAQYLRHWDRVGLIRVALFPFLSGCVDAQGRVAWRSLVPTQNGIEMADWGQYAGFYAFYRMQFDPSQNTWS